MQYQADVLNVPVIRSENVEMTAMGAAYLAGLAIRFWSTEELSRLHVSERSFQPQAMEPASFAYRQWQQYLAKLLS
jgi:glycerol kinase